MVRFGVYEINLDSSTDCANYLFLLHAVRIVKQFNVIVEDIVLLNGKGKLSEFTVRLCVIVCWFDTMSEYQICI